MIFYRILSMYRVKCEKKSHVSYIAINLFFDYIATPGTI